MAEKSGRICSCFGHFTVEITEELKERTRAEIRKAIVEGVTVFYFGGRSDFDDLCFLLVTEEKAQRPELMRILVVPQYRNLRKPPRWTEPEKYDDVIYLIPRTEGWYKSIYWRNCAMIDSSELVLFYVEARESSGAYKTYQYAVRQKKNIVNLKQ